MGPVFLATAQTEHWSQVLFVVLVPIGALMLGGLLHVVYRMGRVVAELRQLRHDVNVMWGMGHAALERRESNSG